jgi:hypothetical protein
MSASLTRIPFAVLILSSLCAAIAGEEPQRTINLGRTSLAAVTASSVNGDRAMDSPFYGILNAFDDGSNWRNGINYTQWLSNYHATGTYAEVRFDVPVTVTSIFTEGAPPFSVRLTAEDGTEQVKNGKDSVAFNPAASKIRRVRLTFENNSEGVVRVDEIRIMGLTSSETKYEVRPPRVLPTERNLELAGDEAFTSWLYPYLSARKKTVRETDDSVVFVYFIEDVPVVRVTIDRRDGSKRIETFSQERSITGEKLTKERPPAAE